MNKEDISQDKVTNLKNLIDFIRSATENGVSPSVEKPLLSILDQVVPFFPHVVLTQEFPELYRLTINRKVIPSKKNKRIRNIKYLKYPQADKVTNYGRCNLPGQSVLYATNYGAHGHSLVTMSEMNPNVGDLVTETTWRVKSNQTLTYSPIFRNQPPNSNFVNSRTLEIDRLHEEKLQTYPKNVRQYIDLLVQFVADAFTKTIGSSNHLDYILSAFFSDKILYAFEKGTIDAIWYPSVKNDLSAENLAIKPDIFDSKYELFEVKDGVVTAKFQGGGSLDGLGECKDFHFASGEVLWNSKIIRQPKYRLKQLQRLYQIELNESIWEKVSKIF